MRSVYRLGLAVTCLAICACNQAPSETQATNSSSGTAPEESPLRAGMYEVSIVETLPGVGASNERTDRQCVDPTMASRPESFLGHGEMSGCTSTEPVRDGHQIRSEIRCEANHQAMISATFTRDSWEQTISGNGPEGSYESHENAQRVGDC